MSDRLELGAGLLNIDKPPGMTSRDVVNRVQWLVKPTKVGHAGTLDPLAVGVLIICLGSATRLIEYVQLLPKRYRGTFLLGQSSPSLDTEHPDEVEIDSNARVPDVSELPAALATQRGTIWQMPPAFSALKVDGRRAYTLARAGKAVELEPRPIEISEIEVVEYAYPRLVLDVTCSSGTYVRAIGRDVAAALGTTAVMSALERTAIGNFTRDQALKLDQLAPERLPSLILPAARAVENLPRCVITAEQFAQLSHGLMIPLANMPASDQVAAHDAAGNLLAIVIPHLRGNWHSVKNIAPKPTGERGGVSPPS